MKLDELPRMTLAHIPTPLEEAPRLAGHLGLNRLLIKRDDQTGLALGGNKARKLEYLMAEAIQAGSDIVLTDGGPQSNHARMTAAAARKLGLDVALVLGGPDFQEFQGNLLLDILMGAPIRFLKDQDVPEMEAEMARLAEELRHQGRRPYIVPIGGSTPIGACGYVRGMRELAGQLGDEKVQIILPVGSCGTLAGCVLGARLFLPGSTVIGISVSRKSAPLRARTAEIASECAELLGVPERFSPDDIVAYDQYYGPAYGVPTPEGRDAIITSARLEGLLLDPVYTGKAMAGLFDLARKGALDNRRPVVFLHTGGVAALFAFEPLFRDLAVCEKRS
ncbi:MAG: D-cysteine desulfhydrase family protein [Armatimonadota bacterium]